VLAAMGVAPEVAAGSLRLSLGWASVADDVALVLDAVPAAVERLRLFA
jgi:cysteine desulfurase